MYHLVSQHNPFRPVHWRWERAKQIVDGTLPFSPKRDDIWVSRAARFLRQYSKCANQLDAGVLSETMPDIFWAHWVWQSDIGGEKYENFAAAGKYTIEARVLAEDGSKNIARVVGLSEDAVIAYEKLFFDVRHRLEQRDYILFQVMGPAVSRGLYAREYDLLWKLHGYMRGIHTLEYIQDGFSEERRHTIRGDAQRKAEEDMGTSFTRKALVTTQALHINSETQADIIGLWIKLKELEQNKRAGGSGDQDAITKGLATFLQVQNYMVGPPPAKVKTRLDRYDSGPIELGGLELTRRLSIEGPDDDFELPTINIPVSSGSEAPAK
jgi:hypothetical protein